MVMLPSSTKYLVLVVAAALLLSSAQAPTLAAELTVPDRVSDSVTLHSAFANNIYLSNYDQFKTLGGTISSYDAMNSRVASPGLNKPTGPSSLNAYTDYFLSNTHDSLTEISNTTNDPFSLDLKLQYLQLIDVDGNLSVQNVVLQGGQTHLFSANLSATVPYVFSFKSHGDTDLETVNLNAITPSGQSYFKAMTLYSHLTNIYTIVPKEAGEYIFSLIPQSGDVVLDKLVIYKDIPTISIGTGFSETIAGTSSTLKLFKLQLNATAATNLLTFDSFTYVQQFIDDYAHNANLLGLIRVKFFTPTSSIFGVSISSAFISPNDTVYAAVEILPPDATDPYVNGEKARLGIPDGFYAEYSFWSTLDPIAPIVQNVDVPIDSPTTASLYHYFSTDVPVAVHFNYSSLGGFSGTIFYKNSSYVQGLTNAQNLYGTPGSLSILQSGEYIISISDSANDGSGSYRFTAVPVSTLGMGATEINYSLNDLAVYHLPSGAVTKDVLNVTYLDHLNLSVTFRLQLFDAEGNSEAIINKQFDQYANNADPNFAQDNNTAVNMLSNLVYHNINGLYFFVRYTSNTVWNSSLASPVALSTDNSSFSANLRIVREDDWATKSFNSTDYDYFTANLGSSYSHALNATKTESLFRFMLTPSVGGNRIVVNAENMTYSVMIASDPGDSWYSTPPVSKIIANQTVYQADFVFPSIGTPLALIVYFNGVYTDNGTLSISVTHTAPVDVDNLFTIHSLAPQKVSTGTGGTDTDIVVDTNTDTTTPTDNSPINPWYIGGGAAAVAVLGGGGFFVYRRRKA